MDRSMFSSTELRLARERRLKFQGTAKIKISQIFLPSEYKPDNVERLRRIFDSEDCDRLSLPNHVVATISRENLMSALSGNQVNANSLMSQPPDSYVSLELPIGQVTCLHGQHRLRAGREFLAPYDRWWTVDLYLDDISRELEAELTDEYANEATPTDGDVYRKVRQYQYEASARFEERWLSRLTENKQKRMRQLSQPENSSIRSAFDSLLPIPGLWKTMSIGNLPRVIAVKCDEEIIHYLRFIRNFWSSLVQDDRSHMGKIDCMTVEKLQLLVPGGLDRTKVKGLVLSGEAFPKFNQSERKSIWRVLRRRGEVVPSLHTFFKDLSYLEVTASCLGRLVDLAALRKRTMRSAMKQIYDPARHGRDRYQIQVSETEFRQCSGTVDEGRESGYRQLWLFAFRHYLQMPKARQKKKRHAKTKFQEANDGVVHRMVSLALQLGFDSPQIQRLMDDSPDRRLALAALLKARERDHYRYDSIDTLVDRIVACFNEAVPIELRAPRASAPFSTIPRQSRCGKPSLETHEQEQNFLFLDQIEIQPPDESVSALFVRRCVYFAFFGRPSETPPTPIDEDHSTRHSSPHPPLSPLFVPEEHNPLDDHPVTGIVDHEIDRPDPQHRDSRREERRQRRRQERETRRRQKQERRRQRESRRQQGSSNADQEGGFAARSPAVTPSHAESSRASSGNVTEVETDAGNELEPTQPENTVEEELGGNTVAADQMPVAADQMPVDPLIAEPNETEHPPGEDHEKVEMEDPIAAPKIIISEPSPEHVPDHIQDNAFSGSTEASAPPQEVDEDGALIQAENDHLAQLPSRHLMESEQAILGSSRPMAVRRSRPLGLKRSAMARRQAAARTRLGGKDRRLTQVEVKRGHQFIPDAHLGVEKLPPTVDLTVQSSLEEVVAEERAQTLAQLEEHPAISESAVADAANPSPSPLLPSMPELIARLRESESPAEGNYGDDTGNPPPENSHQGLRQERSKQPSLEVARPELLTEDRESRRKVPRDKQIAEEARRRREAKQRAENTPRAAQESENDFTQTRSGDDLFNDDDITEPAPLEGNPTAVAVAAAGESQRLPSVSSPSQPLKAGRKQFARHARQGPYRRPTEKGQGDRDRPLTQIDMQRTASDQPSIAPGDPPLPTFPLIGQPPTENAANTLPIPQPNDGNVDRRRKAANMIRERRPPVVTSPPEPSTDLVIFREWTGTRWTERTRVVADQSDPLRIEREAKRLVEAHHAQLRDARMRILMPSQCLQSAGQDRSHSVFLTFENNTVTDAMEKAAAAFMDSRRHRP